jgi:DDE superfamily endonuclease
VPRTFPPAAGWSPNGHRIKAPLDYERGPEKTWVYGALRVRDGKELTRCALSRNSKGYIALLADIFIITDNLSSHNSLETRTWLEAHPRIHQIFIPTGACWLNLQEGWWRLFRRDALAGQSFANPKEIEQATRVATTQLNLRAKPWVWARPPKIPRHYRRLFCYRISRTQH